MHEPMHYAVNNKKLEIVKLLLKLGADVNSARMGQNSMKLSPVHIAVSNTNYDERDLCLDILKCLIREPNAQVIALFTIIRTDRNMLLACYSHKHISYRIRTIIRKAISMIVFSKIHSAAL